MRTIKFRAWDGVKMIYSENKFDEDGQLHELEMFFLGLEVGRSLNNKKYGLMEFTSLLDKNGKEIYEGDIIEVNNDYENEICRIPCVIKWVRAQFVAEHSDGGSWTRQLYDQPERIEIIGNIYENQDLLK